MAKPVEAQTVYDVNICCSSSPWRKLSSLNDQSLRGDCKRYLGFLRQGRQFRHIINHANENIPKELELFSCNSMEGLGVAAQDLESPLASWDLEDKNDPFFTIVFDEVWSLMGDSENEQFIMLNRIIS